MKLLRERLSAFDPQKLGLSFCAHVKPGDGQLLIPFGPDLCACFKSERWIYHCPSHKPGSSRPEMFPDNCCRCRGDMNPNLQGQFMPKEEHEGFTSTESLHHQYPCPYCLTSYSWVREGRTMYLMVSRYMSLKPGLAIQPDWLVNVEPDVWDMRANQCLKHRVWCDEEGCRTGERWAKLIWIWNRPD